MSSKKLLPIVILLTFPLFLNHCATALKKTETTSLKSLSHKSESVYYYLISQLEGFEGKDNKSVFYLDESIKKNSASFLLTLKAYRLAQENKIAEAEKIANKAYKKDPHNADILTLKGKFNTSKGHSKPAIDFYQRAIRLDPEKEEPYNLLAREYVVLNQNEKAIEVLKNLLSINPDYLPAYLYLGTIYTQQKNYKKAIDTYESLLEINSEDVNVLGLLGEIYLNQKKLKKALDYFEEIIRINPEDLTTQVKAALIFYELKDVDKAIASFENILKAKPDAHRIIYYLGLLYQEKNDFDNALKIYSKIPNKSSMYQDALTRQIVILRSMDKTDEALILAKQALDRQPRNTELINLVASIYLIKEDYLKATSVLQKGMQLIPGDENLLFGLAVTLEKSGKWKESIDVMKKVIAVNKDNVMAYNFIGYTYAEHNENLDEAEKMIQKAMALKPNDGFIVDSLAWIFFQKGEVNRALRLLNKAIRLAPKEPTILEHLGDANLKIHDKRNARRYYEEAINELTKKEQKSSADKDQIKKLKIKLGNL